jgi:hypothetical protein
MVKQTIFIKIDYFLTAIFKKTILFLKIAVIKQNGNFKKNESEYSSTNTRRTSKRKQYQKDGVL